MLYHFFLAFIINLGFRILGTLVGSRSLIESFVVEVFHKDFGMIFCLLMFINL
jgi:hypothetical protein